MVNQRAESVRRFHFGWRGTAVFVLVFLGVISLAAFSVVHWTERQLLTTDNWVKIVGPLPKNDQVASALSSYTVNSIFGGVNIEQKISDALPSRADFLAPTLASQLQSTLTKGTKNVIQSDQFSSIWITANRGAHQRLMASARNTAPPAPKRTTNFSLNLSAVRAKVTPLLGKGSGSLLGNTTSSNNGSSGGVSIGVKIKTAANNFRKIVRSIDLLNGVLGLLALVLLLGAVVITYARRRLVQIIGVAILVMGLVELIAVKVARPEVLNQVKNASYKPAVGVVYDNLVATFHRTAVVAVVIGAILWLVAFLVRPGRIKLKANFLKKIQNSAVWATWKSVRLFVRRYLWQICGAVTLLALVLLAFAFSSLTGQQLIRALLILLLILECFNLVATRARSLPMKQAGTRLKN